MRAGTTLLTHDGAGPQLKVNKVAPGGTGSVLFQTGWCGRAEMGLAGNNDFSGKMSTDGAARKTALVVDRASNAASFGPAQVVTEAEDVAWCGRHSCSAPLKLGGVGTPDVLLTVSGSVGGANGTFVGDFQFYAPNIIAGQRAYCTIGKQVSLYERAAFGYRHAGPALPNNRLFFGLF